MAEGNRNVSWDVLTCAELSVRFTRCFEGHVHQALYLSSSKDPRARTARFLGQDKVPSHSRVGILYAKGKFKEQKTYEYRDVG